MDFNPKLMRKERADTKLCATFFSIGWFHRLVENKNPKIWKHTKTTPPKSSCGSGTISQKTSQRKNHQNNLSRQENWTNFRQKPQLAFFKQKNSQFYMCIRGPCSSRAGKNITGGETSKTPATKTAVFRTAKSTNSLDKHFEPLELHPQKRQKPKTNNSSRTNITNIYLIEEPIQNPEPRERETDPTKNIEKIPSSGVVSL